MIASRTTTMARGKGTLSRVFSFLALVVCALALSTPAQAMPLGGDHSSQGIPAGTPPELENVGVDEHLDGQLPMDAQFRDHTGKAVRLGDFFDQKRPVVFVFAYHTCPVVCSLILDDTMKTLKEVPWTLGKEYEMVVISIHPRESLEKTTAKRAGLLASYGRPEADKGLHMLVGDQANIERATKAAGYNYRYDAELDQFAHPSVVMIAKPNGQLARYLYGLEFPPNDVRLGLFEAAEGRSITTVEQIILYCYHYDPKGGKYVLVASRVMQVGGGMTAIVLASVLSMFWIRERRKGGLIAKDEGEEASSSSNEDSSKQDTASTGDDTAGDDEGNKK
jgi:protein SCO1/2